MTEDEARNYVRQRGPNWWNRALYGLFSLWDRLQWPNAEPLASRKAWVKSEAKRFDQAEVGDTAFLGPLLAHLTAEIPTDEERVVPFRLSARK